MTRSKGGFLVVFVYDARRLSGRRVFFLADAVRRSQVANLILRIDIFSELTSHLPSKQDGAREKLSRDSPGQKQSAARRLSGRRALFLATDEAARVAQPR
jgi:hypothetical protein